MAKRRVAPKQPLSPEALSRVKADRERRKEASRARKRRGWGRAVALRIEQLASDQARPFKRRLVAPARSGGA